MEDLLPYFERELVQLRQLGKEFSERYPGVAGRLQLSGDISPDPHIEQLIQSLALLSSRIAKKLDDSYPEFTESLLEMLFPHYLRPFPSCSIIRATHAINKSGGSVPRLLIPRGSEMDSCLVKGTRCRFRTAYDIELSGISIVHAQFDPLISAPSGLRLPPASCASLSVVVDEISCNGPDALRLFIDGDPTFCAALRDALFMRTAGVFVELEKGRWIPLLATPVRSVGFSSDEALVPFDARSHLAYRILSEYFAYPEKFNFIDLEFAQIKTLLTDQCCRISLHFVLTGILPDSQLARILKNLSADNLLQGCSPVVNLFERPGHPIAVTHTAADYGVLADAVNPAAYEVYSVDAVRMIRRRHQLETIADFSSMYSLHHGASDDENKSFWILRHDATLAVTSPGYEKRLTLVDGDFNPMAVDKASLSIRLSCTNRDLPNILFEAGRNAELTPLHDAASYGVKLLRKPTPVYRFSSERGQHWRLISLLALNQQGLGQEGIIHFREMLTLYDLAQSSISRRLITGITQLERSNAVVWMRGKYGAELVHGTEIRLTLDEEAFVGASLSLFVEVLDHFFGLYAQVNSFIELVITSQQTGKELIRCQPRSGYQLLA